MKNILATYTLLLIVGLASSQATTLNQPTNHLPVKILKNTLALTFAKNGTLWRLLPGQNFVYVDYSIDNGLHYSHTVKVNQYAQKISAWPENPPAIEVTNTGRIVVLYYVDEQQKSTSYFSYSDDLGKTFSPAVLISDKAATDMHYMDKMLLDKHGQIHFFWHDKRNEPENSALGSGVLSLYHAKLNSLGTKVSENELISNFVCSCCRTAISLSHLGYPAVLMRMAFPDGARDHALLIKKSATEWGQAKRISDDHWIIDACPEHGPALAIDEQGRSHLTWFSLGNKRQGIFYANTDDYGSMVSEPLALGQLEFLPSHPDVIVSNEHVVLAWTEFNGKETNLYIQNSADRGSSWSIAKKVFSAFSTTPGHPKLLKYNEHIFISWVTKQEGHRIIEVRE